MRAFLQPRVLPAHMGGVEMAKGVWYSTGCLRRAQKEAKGAIADPAQSDGEQRSVEMGRKKRVLLLQTPPLFSLRSTGPSRSKGNHDGGVKRRSLTPGEREGGQEKEESHANKTSVCIHPCVCMCIEGVLRNLKD